MSKRLLHELGHSRSFGRLSLKAKVLWPMLVATSDDQGRGCADDDAIKWFVCPNVPEITIDDVPDLLDEMAAQAMIAVYDTPRGSVYQMLRWWEYQQLQWARPSKFTPPDGWTDRIRYSNRGDYFSEGWETTGGYDAELRKEPQPQPEEPEPEPEPVNQVENQAENRLDFQPNLTQPNSTQLKEKETPRPRRKPKLPPPPSEPSSEYRILRVYTDLVGDLVPNDLCSKAILATVKDEPASLKLWHDVIEGWLLRGWAPGNVSGMLDWYKRGEIPGQRSNGGPSPPPSQPQPTVIYGLDADPEWLTGALDGNAKPA